MKIRFLQRTNWSTPIVTVLVLVLASLTLSMPANAFSEVHTVTFYENVNASDPVSSFETGLSAQTLTLLQNMNPSFSDAGYTFSGWNTALDGSGMSYADGSTYSFSADIGLYAQWVLIPVVHTVTFFENATALDPASSFETGTSAQDLTLVQNMTPPMANAGHAFVDWNTAADGSGVSYADGSTYSFSVDIGLYAQWAPIPVVHTVTFAENDSLADPVYATQTGTTSSTLTLRANLSPALVNPGFTFVDWNTEASGGGVSYADGASYSFSASIQLFAIWTAIPTSTLTFASGSGTGSTGSISNGVGDSITLPSGSGMSNPGYTFVGWNTESDGSGTEYAAGATYVITANQTLYAKWSPDTYIVNYSFDGGTVTATSATFVVGTAALILPSPVFSGNTFDGWFNAETGGAFIGGSGASYVPTGSVQLFAQWTAITADLLTFSANGSTGSIAPISGNTGTSTSLPSGAGFERAGYTFTGWNTMPDGSGTEYAAGATYDMTVNQTLYAQWSVDASYTITFNSNGGSGSIAPIVGTAGSTITLPDQTGLLHAGFQLTRWNTSATGSGTSYSPGEKITPSGSVVLYAQWSGHKLATLFGAIGTFKNDSSILTASLKSQINRIAITIRSRKYSKVDLYGYTSSTGLRSFDVSLSRSRAANVANYLRTRLRSLKVRGVTVLSTGEGSIAGQSSRSYSRVEVFGV